VPRWKKRADGRTTLAVRDELYEKLRAEAFLRRCSIAAVLEGILRRHYEMEVEEKGEQDERDEA
jgi:hypothetical protein